MVLVIKKESCKQFHTCLVVVLVFRFSFHSAQAITQEAKFCCKHTASKVSERHSHWCMGKGERKKNKELSALRFYRVSLSPPAGYFVLTWVIRVSSTSFPSPVLPNPPHTPPRCCCSPAGSVEPGQLECKRAQTQLPTRSRPSSEF